MQFMKYAKWIVMHWVLTYFFPAWLSFVVKFVCAMRGQLTVSTMCVINLYNLEMCCIVSGESGLNF